MVRLEKNFRSCKCNCSSLRLSSVKRFEQGEIEARQRIARPKKSGRHPDRQELLARLRLERILPCTPDQRVQTLRQRNRSDRLRGEVPVMFRWQSTSYWSRDERSGLSDVRETRHLFGASGTTDP